MHRRRFAPADQLLFAALSGDSNPIHMDALAARRTQAGAPVVHGMHALLWALDCAAADGLDLGRLQHVKAQFAKFIPVGQEAALEIAEHAAGRVRLTVHVSGMAAIVAVLRVGPHAPALPLCQPAAAVAKTAQAAALSMPEMDGLSGWLAAPAPDGRLAEAFPHGAARLGPRRLSGLAQTSRLVGMVCPGLHSIYAGLAFDLTDIAPGPDGIGFRVTKADARFRLVEMAVQGDGLAGRVSAFVRHPPVAPPAMADLARHVRPGEFAGTRALVAGGSRGLGALTAMLLAAGGGRVTITYARGRADAEQVRGLIDAACGDGICDVRHYDATLSASPQLADLAGPITQLYYFATPHIFPQKRAGFAGQIFRDFAAVYVDGFHACCLALQPRPASVFYPSSVAVSERPPDMLEYVMAKAAGEVLCDGMRDAGWKIVRARLPRLLTDQTATVANVETADALSVMLPLLRGM